PVRFAPENLTRAPFELGCSPSPASITPAFTSSSLYFPIAARSFSSGITPASESLLALTMIMNRIVFSVGLEAGSPDGVDRMKTLALTVRRTRPGEIDSLNELLSAVDRLEHPAVCAHDDTSFARYSSRRARVWASPSTAP